MRTLHFRFVAVIATACLIGFSPVYAVAALPQTALPGLVPPPDYFPGAVNDPAVPPLERVLGFKLGQRATTAAEIERCLQAWTAAAPDRTKLVEYARTYEGCALHYVVVTAPQNLARQAEIQTNLARLADPRKTTDAQAAQLIQSLPTVVWLAYTIHGDETEGSDAALAVLYHLIAGTDPETAKLREDLVIVIDPLMNPDGRDRFVKMIAEHRGAQPDVDDQSLVHDGYWPYGRGNHYLIDLNRDALWAVHPETRGRLREVARWHPAVFVDAHGMGAQDTHLFAPPREPINPNFPSEHAALSEIFSRDQAQAFDRQHLTYYTGEWNEGWFPGYSDSYVALRRAVGILYEQARVAEDGVRRAEGRIMTYGQSVEYQVIGSMANLRTAQANAKRLLQYQRDTAKEALDPAGRYANRTFAILPSANRSRWHDFAELAQRHGFEMYRTARAFTAPLATNQLGQTLTNVSVPAGTVLIPNRQPLAHLVAAALEFDPRLSAKALDEERREILRRGDSKLYDTTAWNLTMFFDLEALTLPSELPADAEPYRPGDPPAGGIAGASEAAVAYVFDGADDLSVTAAARLMERGVQVRVADEATQLDGRDFARGSVVVTILDNQIFTGDLRAAVEQTASELGLSAVAVRSGLGPADSADLGGEHFGLLTPPRIGLFGRGRFDFTDYGSLWQTLDQRLGTRHANLEDNASLDLARYNVLVFPNAWGGSNNVSLDALKDWVRNGGTLIAIGSSVNRFVAESAKFSQARRLPDVLGKLDDYELTVFREWLGRSSNTVPAEALWANEPPTRLAYPWQAVAGGRPDEKELKKRDAWQALFMPRGALLAARVDTNSWLAFGCAEPLPVLANRNSILMAADGVEAPIRYGFLSPSQKSVAPAAPDQAGANPAAKSDAADQDDRNGGDKKDKPEPPRVGWSALPPGTEMVLRMSGLLWPEATHRLSNTAYVTRERLGRGQIILFATPPTFRSAARGTTRVFLNAVVYGPGLGATHPILP